MRTLALIAALILGDVSNAKLLFEGYYKVERDSNHIGYLVQRDQVDEKTKERAITYFAFREEKGHPSYDAVRSIAKPVGGMAYAPVRYTHVVSGRGKGTTLIEEGIFSTNELKVTATEQDKAKKPVGTYKLPVTPDQFISSFLTAFLVADGLANLKPGAEFLFNALYEEGRFFSAGDFKILRTLRSPDGKRLYHGLSRFASDQTEYVFYSDGQVLGYRNANVIVYLAPTREAALEELPFLKEPIQKIFGDLPFGLENPVSKSLGKVDAKRLMASLPALTEKERKYKVGPKARTLGRR